VALAIAVAWSGLAGQGRVAFATLLAAAITDVLDGRLARKGGGSRLGRHLDAVADTILLAASGLAIVALHPAILGLAPLLVLAGGAYAASTIACWLAMRRLVDPRQLTAKIAGGLLYLFALFTLLTGAYEAALLAAALIALAVASLVTIVKATMTISAGARATPADRSRRWARFPSASRRRAGAASAPRRPGGGAARRSRDGVA
jgi:phosphatidylglycerophosphate synthase